MPSLDHIALGFAPGLLWLYWILSKDRVEPEPRGLVLRAFVFGALSTAPVILLRTPLEHWLLPGEGAAEVWIDAFVVTAGFEELVKLLALAAAVLWHREWDEPLDGVVYGAAVGLGFASIENIIYLSRSGEASLLIARGFTATLAHVSATGTMGFLLGLARLRFGGRRLPWALLALPAAVVLHGSYDLFLFGDGRYAVLSLLVVLPLMLVLLGLKIRWAQRNSPHSPKP